ncbi:MAG: hypothetical protein WBZ42_01415 [Halobacteriota archaeon]
MKDQLKAISTLADLEFRSLTAAQSLGFVHQEPPKINIEERAERMHERMVELCGGDERLQELVARIVYDLSNSSN